MAPTEAAERKQRAPLLLAQKRAELPRSEGVVALAEEPPAVSQTKGNLSGGACLQTLIDQQQASKLDQLPAVPQRVAHEGRGVQAVG